MRARAEAGLAHVPEDRQRRGLILDYSVADNLVLGLQRAFTRRGVLDRAAIEANARARIAEFDVRPASTTIATRSLSGGNQQKIVIAREMSRPSSVLLAAQPTRGVDIGAVELVHRELRKARDAGKAVLLVSADLREVLELSDRVAVLYGGRLAAILDRDRADEETLGSFMTGAKLERAP